MSVHPITRRPAPLPGCRGECGHVTAYACWLEAGADGLPDELAAVLLLAEHGTWLSRPEFTSRYIAVITGPGSRGPVRARVRWRAALAGLRCLPSSPSEEGILRIAASLAAGTTASLRECLASLDHGNARAVVRAIALAAGDVLVPDDDGPHPF